MSWVATAIAGSAVLGAGASIWGANKAASTQQEAARTASQLQEQMFGAGANAVGTAQGGVSSAAGGAIAGLAPFTTLGGQTAQQLQMQLPSLTASFNPTMQDLENTPGYRFTLDQGLKATTNANSAMGLADSGTQGKGIANYAEGLAGTTFQQQFQNYLQQNQQKYNMLMGPTTLGAGTAGTAGGFGLSGAQANLGGAESLMGGAMGTGGQVGSNIMGGANAGAAGTMATANAVGGLGNNFMNQYMQYMMLQKLGMAGGGAGLGTDPVANGGFGTGGFNFLDATMPR